MRERVIVCEREREREKKKKKKGWQGDQASGLSLLIFSCVVGEETKMCPNKLPRDPPWR